MPEVWLIAAIVFCVAFVVQTFRLYDANDSCKSYKIACEVAEKRFSENINELRRVEKEHSRMVQMITDFADRLNE